MNKDNNESMASTLYEAAKRARIDRISNAMTETAESEGKLSVVLSLPDDKMSVEILEGMREGTDLQITYSCRSSYNDIRAEVSWMNGGIDTNA